MIPSRPRRRCFHCLVGDGETGHVCDGKGAVGMRLNRRMTEQRRTAWSRLESHSDHVGAEEDPVGLGVVSELRLLRGVIPESAITKSVLREKFIDE